MKLCLGKNKMSYCDLKREGQVYDSNAPMNFDAGYSSHIRGVGTGCSVTHVFPGLQMAGNEAGANGPLYASNPDIGYIIQVNRRYQQNGATLSYIRTPDRIIRL